MFSKSKGIRVKARPFDYLFPKDHSALVIIDMQRDFLEPGGFAEALGNDVGLTRGVIPKVGKVLNAWRELGLPVIYTREVHQPDLSDCPTTKRHRGSPRLRIGDCGPMGRILIAGEAGSDIVPELYPRAGEVVLDKPGKGAFYSTPLAEILKKRGVTHLVFTGVTTEVCVQSTMREANDRGYECLLLSDCTDSFFPHFR